jgi:hypothetical protein
MNFQHAAGAGDIRVNVLVRGLSFKQQPIYILRAKNPPPLWTQ